MKGYLSAFGLSPNGTDQIEFFVSEKQIEDFKFRGDAEKFFEAHSIVEVFKNPTAIFQGLKRPEYELAFCYVGIPKRYGDRWEGPPPPGFVFAVYATSEFKVFEWGWERADKQDGAVPIDALTRYGKMLWKRS